MTSAKERVEIELAELKEKLESLCNLLCTPLDDRLHPNSIKMLLLQKDIMMAYVGILEMRLENW
jgi:hypothetical protein